MISEGLLYVTNNLPSIMTGLTMALIGISLYETRDGFFLFNGQFRGKYGALIIFLAVLIGASLITPEVERVWKMSLPSILPGQLLGMVLLLGMLGVNKAAEWNFLDVKSLPIYGIGVILIFRPDILQAIM